MAFGSITSTLKIEKSTLWNSVSNKIARCSWKFTVSDTLRDTINNSWRLSVSENHYRVTTKFCNLTFQEGKVNLRKAINWLRCSFGWYCSYFYLRQTQFYTVFIYVPRWGWKAYMVPVFTVTDIGKN